MYSHPITTSVFEIFKVGPGPSSSHTMGPMVAAREFVTEAASLPPDVLRQARSITVRLLGSLASTGRGHGTVRAVLAGLLGHMPESCPTDILESLHSFSSGIIDLGGHSVAIAEELVTFDMWTPVTRHPNTIQLALVDASGAPLLEREVYSIGGGFVEWAGQIPQSRPIPPYAFSSMRELLAIASDNDLTIPQIVCANETAISGLDPIAIAQRLGAVLTAMQDAVNRGLNTSGVLPGPLGLHRKAPMLFSRYKDASHTPNRLILALCACGFAAAEENAAGHTVVTAPTAGGSGVLPAVLYVINRLEPGMPPPPSALRDGLLAAAVVGQLAKHNASISGAEVGCQGEVGVAAAMSAAFLAQVYGCPPQIVENAAEIALEHHLGMTCDPVQGYVQVPCIERNAMGAVKAYAAYQIAATESPCHHLVGLDQTIAAMAETGRDMCIKYKETAQGGLANCL